MMSGIGNYKIIRQLGKGGMSEVYEVENERLGSHHALKLFTYEKDDAEVRRRFLTEGKLLARLNHPRIVRVTDFGTDEASGKPYFVMDLILDEHGQTRSLSDVEPGMADEQEIGRWYDDLREGLSYIHANGVIHRDLKLQNVLIGPDGHAVLTDFGISKIFDVQGDGKTIVDVAHTIVKMKEGRSLVMGSIGYMAPELEMGVAASPQSDWYALGVIVYRLLTGSWCDARTDVVKQLETYDPVWSRILPKLLHANPQGRECLSYFAEKVRDRERAEFEAEERFLSERSRGRLARHAARWLAAVVIVMVAVVVGLQLRFTRTQEYLSAEANELRHQLAIPTFSNTILPEVAVAPTGTIAFVDRTLPTMADAWVLTHQLFDDLQMGRITREKACETLGEMARKSKQGAFGLFDINRGYMPTGDQELLRKMLNTAAEKLSRDDRL